MVICGKCGMAYDDIKEKHKCLGPPDLTRVATMKDIQDIKLSIAQFRSEILQMLVKLSGRIEDSKK
jgi:hypothetical protein